MRTFIVFLCILAVTWFAGSLLLEDGGLPEANQGTDTWWTQNFGKIILFLGAASAQSVAMYLENKKREKKVRDLVEEARIPEAFS